MVLVSIFYMHTAPALTLAVKENKRKEKREKIQNPKTHGSWLVSVSTDVSIQIWLASWRNDFSVYMNYLFKSTDTKLARVLIKLNFYRIMYKEKDGVFNRNKIQ